MGRDESSDFQLPVSTVSRQHAKIFETDGVYLIEDLGSTHGTVLNGNKLGQGEKVILRDGDIIELTRAKITCAIETEDLDRPDPMEATQAIAARAVQGILGRLQNGDDSGPYFRILSGVDEGQRLMLGGPASEWFMGRAQECELVLNDPNVSRKHALVKKTGMASPLKIWVRAMVLWSREIQSVVLVVFRTVTRLSLVPSSSSILTPTPI